MPRGLKFSWTPMPFAAYSSGLKTNTFNCHILVSLTHKCRHSGHLGHAVAWTLFFRLELAVCLNSVHLQSRQMHTRYAVQCCKARITSLNICKQVKFDRPLHRKPLAFRQHCGILIMPVMSLKGFSTIAPLNWLLALERVTYLHFSDLPLLLSTFFWSDRLLATLNRATGKHPQWLKICGWA